MNLWLYRSSSLDHCRVLDLQVRYWCACPMRLTIAHTACILSAWYEQRIVSARSDLLRQRRSSVMLAVCLCVSVSVSKTTRPDAAGYGRMFLDR